MVVDDGTIVGVSLVEVEDAAVAAAAEQEWLDEKQEMQDGKVDKDAVVAAAEAAVVAADEDEEQVEEQETWDEWMTAVVVASSFVGDALAVGDRNADVAAAAAAAGGG